MKQDIIQEFIDATPKWLEELKKQRSFGGTSICPICGIDSKKIEKLLKAVKELKEEAWQYDELFK